MLTDKIIARRRAKLLSQIKQREAALAHKRAVMARHTPGTSWHTNAARSVATLEGILADLHERLAQL
jgi:hypothetical protein